MAKSVTYKTLTVPLHQLDEILNTYCNDGWTMVACLSGGTGISGDNVYLVLRK